LNNAGRGPKVPVIIARRLSENPVEVPKSISTKLCSVEMEQNNSQVALCLNVKGAD